MSDLEPIIAPFEPARFDTAVDHYVKHRIRYDPRLIDRLCRDARIDTTSRVLDLGCGPGFIANALAPRAGEVIGLDPSEPMIEAARAEAAALGRTNVTFWVGSSRDIDELASPLHLVAMGRSFHWMDRAATLDALDRLVAPGGTVALLSDRVVDAPENAWYRAFNDVARAHSHIDECGAHRHSPDWAPHTSILMRSAFRDVARLSVFAHHEWTPDALYGFVRSRSGTAPGTIPEKAAREMRAAFEATLAPYLEKGPLVSLHEHSAILARRPND